MTRVKRGIKARRRRKKILKLAKGQYGARSRSFKVARESVERGLVYAYRDRRRRKRDFRRLWITRINAAARLHNLSYTRFIEGLKKSSIQIDRKILAELAISDPEAFAQLVDQAKQTQVKEINSKSQSPNPKQIQNSNFKIQKV